MFLKSEHKKFGCKNSVRLLLVLHRYFVYLTMTNKATVSSIPNLLKVLPNAHWLCVSSTFSYNGTFLPGSKVSSSLRLNDPPPMPSFIFSHLPSHLSPADIKTTLFLFPWLKRSLKSTTTIMRTGTRSDLLSSTGT